MVVPKDDLVAAKSQKMKASTLISFMNGKDQGGLLKQEISRGVARMKSQMKRKGASAPIHVVADVQRFIINESHVRRICDSYDIGILDEFEVVYITTAMELQGIFSFESNLVEEAVSLLSDPVANGPLDKHALQNIYLMLDS